MRINQDRRRFLSTAAATIAGLEVGMLGATKSLVRGIGIAGDSELRALRGATAWLNTPPLSADGLRGKVVLVDFCTYTCINWLRTLPYVRAWAEKYGEHGLVVIGAHTPEFAFERDLENVRRAIAAMRVPYPIAVDNDYAVWNGFSNQYWPALYLLDAKGTIRFTHFGEGAYDQSERSIQQLLVEAGAGAFSTGGLGQPGIGRDLSRLGPSGALRPQRNALATERMDTRRRLDARQQGRHIAEAGRQDRLSISRA